MQVHCICTSIIQDFLHQGQESKEPSKFKFSKSAHKNHTILLPQRSNQKEWLLSLGSKQKHENALYKPALAKSIYDTMHNN